MEVTFSRTDNLHISIHGFGKSAFDSLPGKKHCEGLSEWKTMILGDATITFFRNDL